MRLLRVLDTGPRKPSILEAFASHEGYSREDFERAIGWLFLKGMVVFKSRKRWRLLARNGRAGT